jgi:predicted molibdopterin-dependent oxidoreductase YjgC
VRGAKAIVFREVDGRQEVGTPFDRPLEEVGCQFCGACVDSCPTGALRDRIEVERPEGKVICGDPSPPLLPGLDSQSTWKYTICPYCGVGCRLACEVRDAKIVGVRPDARGPANRGQACVKGRFGIAEFVHGSERLTTPLIRNGNGLEPTSWENALSRVADALKRYKPEEVAVLASAKCTNEENYVIQKFARAVLKTNSVDHCARL